MITHYIGIDPGRQTGICVYDRNKKRIHELHTFTFWQTIKFLSSFRQYMGGLMSETDEFEVVLEDPGLNKPIFFPKVRTMTERIRLSKAQDVGRNKEDAYLLEEFCKFEKIKYRIVRPSSAKWNAKYFQQVTKCMEVTNQHERDSSKLCWGL